MSDVIISLKLNSSKVSDTMEQSVNLGLTYADATQTASQWTATATTAATQVTPPGNVLLKGVSWIGIKNHAATNTIALRTAQADTYPFATVGPGMMQPIQCAVAPAGALNLWVTSSATTAEYSAIAIGLLA